VTDRDWSDAHLIHAAMEVHHDDPEFGYRFIADELPARGITAGRNRVNRLCTQQRLFSVHAKKRGTGRKPGPPVHEDLVRREFTAKAPNRLWLTDITEHPTAEGKLYLCAVKDACTNRIVGYSIDDRMTSQLAVDALGNAVTLRRPAGTVVHSDRGSQFRSHAFVHALRVAGLTGSMGRVGACADNAAMESFFSLLQKNVLNRKQWTTRQDLRLAIGSRRPITGAAAKTPSDVSHRSNTRHFYEPLTRPDRPAPTSQRDRGQTRHCLNGTGQAGPGRNPGKEGSVPVSGPLTAAPLRQTSTKRSVHNAKGGHRTVAALDG
jgi:putative transposase